MATVATRQRPRSETPRRTQLVIRVNEDEKAAIEERAGEHGLNVSDYLVRSALGTLDVAPSDIQQQLDVVADRLERLERATFG